MTYQDNIAKAQQLIGSHPGTWDGINAESVARMKLQNRFNTGLDIAKYTAGIMRRDMAAYDLDPTNYTQSLGCWHGFIGQQKMIAIKKHFCPAGWSPRSAPTSARCPTSRCMKRPAFPR